MARFAVINNNKVVDVIEAAPGYVYPGGFAMEPSADANIGDVWNPAGRTFTSFTLDPAYDEGAAPYEVIDSRKLEMVSAVHDVTLAPGKVVRLTLEDETVTRLMLYAEWGKTNAAATRGWSDPLGNVVTLTGADFVTLYSRVVAARLDIEDQAINVFNMYRTRANIKMEDVEPNMVVHV